MSNKTLAVIVIAAFIVVFLILGFTSKRDAFWDMFPHEVTEPALQDTTVR